MKTMATNCTKPGVFHTSFANNFQRLGKRLLSAGAFALIFAIQATAQTTPATKTPIRNILNDTAGQYQIEQTLVELAMKSPEYQKVVHEGRIREYELKGARNTWMNLLTLSANYNEFSFAKNTNQPVVFPRYFFGLNIPLGTILSRTQVKSANEQVQINKLNQEEIRRSIRASILGKYKQYRSYSVLMALESENLNDVEAALLQAEESFRKGTINIEAYNSAQAGKTASLAKMVDLRLQQEILELEIEKIIGTDLENVIKK